MAAIINWSLTIDAYMINFPALNMNNSKKFIPVAKSLLSSFNGMLLSRKIRIQNHVLIGIKQPARPSSKPDQEEIKPLKTLPSDNTLPRFFVEYD